MLSASSPDSAPGGNRNRRAADRAFLRSFKLCWNSNPTSHTGSTWQQPAAAAHRAPPQRAPTLRFFAAGQAEQDLERLIQSVRATTRCLRR